MLVVVKSINPGLTASTEPMASIRLNQLRSPSIGFIGNMCTMTVGDILDEGLVDP